MSGHSKWSTIKRKKALKDVEKGKIFTKLGRAITVAVLEGGGLTDPEKNVKLRLAVAKARAASMPKDTIQRAIEKGAGGGAAKIQEVFYEGFALGGVSLIIHGATDNPNRTSSELRNVLEKHGGKLGAKGAVSYLFQKCGSVAIESISEEEALAIAEKLMAFDVVKEEGGYTVYFPFENLGQAGEQISSVTACAPELDFRPLSPIQVEASNQEKIVRLIEAIEDLDDVQQVYSSAVF